MSNSKAPAAPDYTGAANATAAGSLEAARATAAANRPNYYTPGGSQTATRNAQNPDQWDISQNLSPDQQALFDQGERISGKFGDLAEQGLGQVGGTLAKGIDWNALPTASVNPGQTGQDAIMARIRPQLEADQASQESRLAEQGIQQGSQAYDSAMGGLAKQRNDAYSQAALQGISLGDQSRNQALQEQVLGQSNTINLLNALRSGSQVSLPNFQPVGQQANVAGPDLQSAAANTYGANLGSYNAGVAQDNNNTQSAIALGNLIAQYYS